MVLKNAIIPALCAGFLMSGSTALADQYRAGELIGLDLPSALLSPKRLGPDTQFAPIRIEARTERKPVKTERVIVRKPPGRQAHVAQQRTEKPRGAARARVVRRHGNPLDAQARDTRIQTWPCKSGGICDWQR